MPTFRHSRNTEVLVNEYLLSSYFRISDYKGNVDTPETTSFKSDNKTYITGTPDATMSLGGLFSKDANGVEDTLRGILGDSSGHIVTVAPEGFGFGNTMTCLVSNLTSLVINSSVSDVVALTSEFNCKTAHGVGVFLNNEGLQFDEDTVGTTHVSELSNFGGLGVLHVWSNTFDDTTTFSIEHADDSLIWINLGTFTTLGAGAIGSYYFLVDNDVEKNLRWSLAHSATSGSMNVVIGFARFNS